MFLMIIRGYLRIFYGDDYLNRKKYTYVEPPQMIVSAYMSWEKFSRRRENDRAADQMITPRLSPAETLGKGQKKRKISGRVPGIMHFFVKKESGLEVIIKRKRIIFLTYIKMKTISHWSRSLNRIQK